MQKERKEYTNRKILEKDTNVLCSDVSSMNSNDYGSCVISFDNAGKATVKVTGKGEEAFAQIGALPEAADDLAAAVLE